MIFAMHIIAAKLGQPQSSIDAYSILKNEEMLSPTVVQKMKDMLHLINIEVNDPHEIDIELLKNTLDNHLDDLLEHTNTSLVY